MSGRVARVALAVAVRLLPDARRERYREEWAADLRDASMAGISTAQLVTGAFGVVLRAPRSPEAFGLTQGALTGRRLRWAAAWITAAAMFALAGFLTMPFTGSVMGGLRSSLLLVALLTGAVGLVWLAAAMHGLLASRGAGLRWTVSLGVVLLAVPLLGALSFALPMAMMLAGLVAGVWVFGLAWGLPIARDPERRRTWPGLPARFGTRPTALIGAVVVLGGAALAVLHILVWNPQSKVPGLALPELYAQMADRGEPAGAAVAWALVWGASWVPLALLFLATAVFGNRGVLRHLDARRVAPATLVAVAGIGFTQWVAGFSMGM
jgi:hypothetical protein